MSKCVPVKLTADVVVDGSGPVILIGPNGSGKTRLGVKMVSLNQADMVPALRDIALPPDITLRSLTAATQELRNVVQRQRTNPWLMSNEINWLFGKLMIADSGSAVRFRDRISAGENPDIETTKLMRLRLSWTHLFPGRHISFAGREPTVVYGDPSVTSGYPAQQISDGERVALYLAGHVLDTASSILIVDEPEVHFHSSSLLSSGQRWSRCGQMYALFISPTIFLSPCRGATHDS